MPIPATDAFDHGLAVANAGGDEAAAVVAIQEESLVKNWWERIDAARAHDQEAYKQLAKDRAYARGDSIFTTKVNVIGSYIDTWTSLLYARDPDIDVAVAETTGKKGIEDARHFAKTLQIVIGKLWRKAGMKRQAKPWVRAGLTSQVSWMKVTWQERQGIDPVTDKAIADLTDNLATIETLIREGKDAPDLTDNEARAERLRLAIEGLKAKVEAKTVRGLCIDPIDMADITVSDEAPSIGRYLDSPWISHRTYMRVHTAKGLLTGLTEADFAKASHFGQKQPKAPGDVSASLVDWAAEDANSYSASEAINSVGKGTFVCIEEVWDRDTNQVITLVRGINKYARPPYAPDPGTSRFYPFFGLMFTEVDGQRWAQSLNQRSQSLQDAFSRCFQAFEDHRARIKPKTMFQAGMMDSINADKLVAGVTTELVAVETTNPKQDLRQLLVPVNYPQIDMAAYDVGPVMKQFELIWGLQEALTASIDVAKTATEAEIQQSGTNSRTTDKRDRVEDDLQDMAQYTAEIAVQKLTTEDVQILAGLEALWPEGLDIEDLDQLGTVSIRAGSSGKPNTRAMRDAWAAIMPLIQGLLEKIGALRMSSPLEMADKLEELITETAARSGENMDPERFIPQVGEPMQLLDPATMMPVLAYPAPQQPGMDPGMEGGPGATAPGLGDPAVESLGPAIPAGL